MRDLERITARPSYCGPGPVELRASAAITAEAHGAAFIVATKTTPDRCGGRVFVSTVPDPSYLAPTVLLETVRRK